MATNIHTIAHRTLHAMARMAATATVLAACTAELPEGSGVGQGSGRPVALDVYTSQPLTRADSTLLADKVIPVGKSIGVYAYYHDDTRWSDAATPNFMFNQRAVCQGTERGFTYSPIKYWPNEENDKLSLIAYYPYVATTPASLTGPDAPATTGITPLLANTGTGLPTFDFAVKNDVKQQVDFLVSELVPNMPHSRDTDADPATPFNDLTIGDRVRFHFMHATAKVEFQVVIDDDIRADLAYFNLKSLGITKIYTTGRLTPSFAAGEGTTLTWSSHDVIHDYPCKEDEAYLLLPQTLRSDALLTISYDLAFKSGGTTYTYGAGGTPVAGDEYLYADRSASVQLNTLTVGDVPLTAWLPNHRYVYRIRIGARPVSFTAQVADWGDRQGIFFND